MGRSRSWGLFFSLFFSENLSVPPRSFRFSGKKKDPQKKNIIFLGDSFTYGMGLSYEKTFAGILEQKNENFNFYNFGVAGYSPTVYLNQ